MNRLLDKHKQHMQYRNIIKRRLAKFHYEIAYFYKKASNPKIARKHYLQACRFDLGQAHLIGLMTTFFPKNFVKFTRKIRRK